MGGNGAKKGEFGVEKWSLKPELVDGCGRSGYRVVGPVVSKTVVLQSRKSKKCKKSKTSRIILEIQGLCLVSVIIKRKCVVKAATVPLIGAPQAAP